MVISIPDLKGWPMMQVQLSSRRFTFSRPRIVIVAILAVLLLAASSRAEDTEQSQLQVLPLGSAKQALQFEHFPSPLHAVVWRNWGLVPVERLAKTLGTSPSNIEELAQSMGLPKVEPVPEHHQRSIYITLIRRNWHLLPYEQLLTLLNMSAEELAFALREDDFLFIKLGNLKPRCEPVRYEAPDSEMQRRAAGIKQLVQEKFPRLQDSREEPRLTFIEQLSQAPEVERHPANRPGGEEPRFIYSYFGAFGDSLLHPQVDSYPDGLLARLAEQGVNGVWLHVVLRDLAPGNEDFPEFGEGHKQRLENLRTLVARAKKHGIDVYLYINEPRAMPSRFFQARPEMAGVREGEYLTLCTSDMRVRRWMRDSLAHVFREVPGLGGVFTITASENLTNCASHGHHKDCARCGSRSDVEILAEVVSTIEKGVHAGNPEAKVIAWDWGWRNHGDASEIIAALPDRVYLMSVSEWALPITRGGVASHVGEYSLSAVGPGPRASRHWKLAKDAGLKTIAKVQLNASWELSSLPYLPVLDLVAQHCKNLAQADVDGVMLSWSLGGYPSPNLQVAQHFARTPTASVEEVLDRVARERYGDRAAAKAREAWTAFSDAFTNFPYDGRVVYRGPQQMGPANLLFAQKTGYSSTMVGIPYDDLNGWRGPYPPEVFAEQFDRIATGWTKGLEHFEQVLELTDAARRSTAEADLRIAKAAALHFASVANQARFVIARDANPPLSGDGQHKQQILDLLNAESNLAQKLHALAVADSRIGFEASNQYFYVPNDLIEKVINCEHLRKKVSSPE